MKPLSVGTVSLWIHVRLISGGKKNYEAFGKDLQQSAT